MEENQIFEQAQQMFLNGAGRKAVMDFIEENGIAENESGSIASKAYQSVKEQINQKRLQESAKLKEEGRRSGIGSIGIGALLLVGGIIATMATNRVWYGAMAVGAISLVKGIVQATR